MVKLVTSSLFPLCFSKYELKNLANLEWCVKSQGIFWDVLTAIYQFWAHLICVPKLGKSGKKRFSESKHIFCVLFFFIISKNCTKLIWNIKYINKKFWQLLQTALQTDRQTDWQIPGKSTETTLFRHKKKLGGYCCQFFF